MVVLMKMNGLRLPYWNIRNTYAGGDKVLRLLRLQAADCQRFACAGSSVYFDKYEQQKEAADCHLVINNSFTYDLFASFE